MLIGFGIIFLGLIKYFKNRYPIKGRLGITTFYLMMAAICFNTTLGWIGFLWVAASIMTMIDLKIYEIKQKNRK